MRIGLDKCDTHKVDCRLWYISKTVCQLILHIHKLLPCSGGNTLVYVKLLRLTPYICRRYKCINRKIYVRLELVLKLLITLER